MEIVGKGIVLFMVGSIAVIVLFLTIYFMHLAAKKYSR